MKKDCYTLTKEKILSEELEYPEKAIYEGFLKLNANHWLDLPFDDFYITDCGNFGRSVFPQKFDTKVHDKVELKIWIGGVKTRDFPLLPHQIYLHELVLTMWRAEQENKSFRFEIVCIRKEAEKNTFYKDFK